MESSRVSLDGLLLQLRRDVLAAMVEYLGTTLFLLMGLGGIQAAAMSNQEALKINSINGTTVNNAVNTVASIEQLLYISTSMGLALLAAAWTFFRVSGSVFNPNVAIALLLTGALKPMRFVLYVIAEILGAITASALLSACLPGPLAVGAALGVGTKVWQGLIIEAFLTCALTLTVLLVAVEKHRATPFAPVAIGLVLFAAHLLGVIYTGAAMNSARAFGPDVITGFKSYHWVYWIGPSLGAVAATLIYFFLKSVDYYALNPKQDSDDIDDSPDLKGIEVKMRRRHDLHARTSILSHHDHTNFVMPFVMQHDPMHPAYDVTGAHPAGLVYPTHVPEIARPSSPTNYGYMPHDSRLSQLSHNPRTSQPPPTAHPHGHSLALVVAATGPPGKQPATSAVSPGEVVNQQHEEFHGITSPRTQQFV